MCRYNMTKFAIYLNEVTPGLKGKLAPTDSRLRPDQHALEEGVYDQVCICTDCLTLTCAELSQQWQWVSTLADAACALHLFGPLLHNSDMLRTSAFLANCCSVMISQS